MKEKKPINRESLRSPRSSPSAASPMDVRERIERIQMELGDPLVSAGHIAVESSGWPNWSDWNNWGNWPAVR